MTTKNSLGILVRLTGEAKCQFIEVEGERNMTHVGDETYLQKDLYLLGNDSGTRRGNWSFNLFQANSTVKPSEQSNRPNNNRGAIILSGWPKRVEKLISVSRHLAIGGRNVILLVWASVAQLSAHVDDVQVRADPVRSRYFVFATLYAVFFTNHFFINKKKIESFSKCIF